MQGLSLEILVKMCLDIAEGMAYLADKKFVQEILQQENVCEYTIHYMSNVLMQKIHLHNTIM